MLLAILADCVPKRRRTEGLRDLPIFGRLDDVERTAAYARQTASTMAELGLNLNFAPVVDLNLNPNNPAIGISAMAAK